GPQRPYHIGPADIAPTRYLWYANRHYQAATTSGPVRRDTELYVGPGAQDLPPLGPAQPPADQQTLRQNAEAYSAAFHRLVDTFLHLPPQALALPAASTGRDAIADFYTAADQPVRQATVDRLGRAHA